MKKGITLTIAVMAVTIMLILITSSTVIGGSAISAANFEKFNSMLTRTSDNINEYYIKNKSLPIKDEIIDINSLGSEFVNAVAKNNDLESTFKVVDMTKIEDPTVTEGNGTIESKDVFLVAEETHNIYYLKGFKYKGVVYFGL